MLSNVRPGREYISFTPAQILRKCSEQRPSNKDDFDSSVTGVHRSGPASDLIFVPQYMIIVVSSCKCTLCITPAASVQSCRYDQYTNTEKLQNSMHKNVPGRNTAISTELWSVIFL
jgi:hypothetical protein